MRTASAVFLLSICLIVALAFALFAFKEDWIPLPYSVHPPAAAYLAPRDQAEAQRDDLDYLRNITHLDWSYTDRSRAEANGAIDSALRRKLPMSPAAFQLVVAHVLAIADNGHTNVKGATTANRFNRLPLRFYVFADGVYVVRALPAAKSLLGAKLLSIDGVPLEALRPKLSLFTGGTENEKNARLPFYLESPELLNAAGLAKQADRVSLVVTDAQGQGVTVSVLALPADAAAPKLWPSEEIKPQSSPGAGPQWQSALAGKADSLPMFADEPTAFFAGPLSFDRAYYIRFDTNDDDGNISIRDFDRRTLDQILVAQPSNVIVDLRMNGGGDYTNTASFMKELPAKLSNTTFYVLISQETFSAGMTSAAFLKRAGGARVIFVGDKPGDRIRFHSEGGDFCLPYSHICMTARTAIHDYSNKPCRPLFECYLLDLFYPAGIESFDPQIYAPLTFAALSGGHDPALDAIRARILRKKSAL